MNKTVFEEGIEQGIEKGIEKGELFARQDMALAILAARFGPVSPELRSHVLGLDSTALRQLVLRVTKAVSLGEAGLPE